VVTHQLQVERKTGKVRRPETDVLPLCHATNLNEHVFMRYDTTRYSYSARDRGAEHCDERARVCVFVCPRPYLQNCTSDLHQMFCACYLWPWLGPPLAALCASAFIGDVIFAHKPRLLDVAAQLKRRAHAALGLFINCAQ